MHYFLAASGKGSRVFRLANGPRSLDAELHTIESVNAPNVLGSYAYKAKCLHLARHPTPVNLLIDSGAYTAWSLGRPIDREAYLDWCLSLKRQRPTNFISLDVIGDQKRSDNNWMWLRDRGLVCLPVFTHGGDLETLRDLCQESDYVAIGGLVPHWRKKHYLTAYLHQVFEIAGSTRLHLLGIGSEWVSEIFPVFSADSTGWSSPLRFGRRLRACRNHPQQDLQTDDFILTVMKDLALAKLEHAARRRCAHLALYKESPWFTSSSISRPSFSPISSPVKLDPAPRPTLPSRSSALI